MHATQRRITYCHARGNHIVARHTYVAIGSRNLKLGISLIVCVFLGSYLVAFAAPGQRAVVGGSIAKDSGNKSVAATKGAAAQPGTPAVYQLDVATYKAPSWFNGSSEPIALSNGTKGVKVVSNGDPWGPTLSFHLVC